MAGEEIPHITIKMPQSPALGREVQTSDLIWVWDSIAGKLRQSPVSELPFGSSGGGGGTMLGSPFKLRTTDTQVIITEVSPGVWKTVISDVRLIGKTDYPVSCTQLNNACFDDEYLTYNSSDGSVSIQPFKLLEGKVLILYPDGLVPGSGGGGSVQDLQDQIDELKLILAPFIPTMSGANGGRMIWMRPAADIPAGWEEDTAFRGRVVMGEIPGDSEFGYGMSGGSATHTNTLEEMVPHDHALDERVADSDWRTSGGSGTPIAPVASTPERRTGKSGGYEPNPGDMKVAKPYSIMNPYRIVEVIKYVGI